MPSSIDIQQVLSWYSEKIMLPIIFTKLLFGKLKFWIKKIILEPAALKGSLKLHVK